MAVANIPAELRALPSWLVWKYEQHDGEPKPRKVPYCVGGGRRFGQQGSDRDRASLATFDAACAAVAMGGFDGIGFALMPEFNIVAQDFDKCVSAGGKVKPEVAALVAGGYAEFSPSGEGIRAFVRGNLGNHKSRATPTQYGIEVFSDKGFVTVTGNMLPWVDLLGHEDTIPPVSPAFEALCSRRFGENRQAPVGEPDAADEFFASMEKPMGLTISEMEELLAKLDPDMGRDDWIRVGMALHFECSGDDTGFTIWDEWSANSGKYPSSEALKEQWDSFSRPRHKGSRPVTMATVKWMVKQAAQTNTGQQECHDNGGLPPNTLPSLDDRDIANTTSTGYKRRPLIDGVVYLGELMNLSSAGGLGKSTPSSMLALSVATGRDLLNVKVPHRRKVLLINGEDSRGEINMKLHAARMYHNIEEADLHGRVFSFGSEDATNFCLIENDVITRQVRVRTSALQTIGDYVREQGIGLVVIDPLVSFFPGDMNANGTVGAVMLALKRIAVETDCAIVIVQHVAKGTNAKTNGADSASGAASTVNLSRTAFGIVGVELADAAKLGIMPGDEKYFFTLINTKNNLSVQSDFRLFKREAVPMHNGTPEFPDQDWIPVAIPYTPPEGGLAYPPQMLRDVLAVFAKGTIDGHPFSPTPGRSNRTFAPVMAVNLKGHYPNQTTPVLEKIAKAIFEKLKSDGLVIIADMRIQKSSGGGGSNNGKAVLVRWSQTEWSQEPSPGPHTC
jgi:hypothetical protein